MKKLILILISISFISMVSIHAKAADPCDKDTAFFKTSDYLKELSKINDKLSKERKPASINLSDKKDKAASKNKDSKDEDKLFGIPGDNSERASLGAGAF